MENELSEGDMNYTAGLHTLERLNSVEVGSLIPTLAFMFVICVVGLVGNGLVIHVYRTRYNMSNSKYLVLCLSTIDFLTSCISIPLDFSTTLDQYTFQHQWLCKVSRMFNVLGTVSSAFILLFIAIDRYRKVCKPFGWQIQIQMTKILCGTALFLGVMMAWPAGFVFGIHTFDIPEYNLVGSVCSTADEMISTKYPFIYTLMFILLFVGCLTAMSILYSLIGLKVRKQARKMNVFGQKMSVPKPSSSNVTSDIKLDEVKTQYMSRKFKLTASKDQNMDNEKSPNFTNSHEKEESFIDQPDTEEPCSSIMKCQDMKMRVGRLNTSKALKSSFNDTQGHIKLDPEVMISRNTNQIGGDEKRTSLKTSINARISIQESENDKCKTKVNQDQEILHGTVLTRLSSSVSSQVSNLMLRLKFRTLNAETKRLDRKIEISKQARARKTTFLMFVVSLGFIISFLPHLLLMLIWQIKEDFADSLSETEKAVYKFVLRSYFLSCAINPVIYSIINSRFKAACKDMFRKMTTCSKS